MMACITSTKLAISFSGRTSEYFKPTSGMRQGDPISPLVFVLCVERISHVIEEARRIGKWNGIMITNEGPCLTHLLFADDMILMGEATVQQAEIIK